MTDYVWSNNNNDNGKMLHDTSKKKTVCFEEKNCLQTLVLYFSETRGISLISLVASG